MRRVMILLGGLRVMDKPKLCRLPFEGGEGEPWEDPDRFEMRTPAGRNA